MKIVKPTFESLLQEINSIYLRLEDERGIKSVIAGGLNKNGVWVEFPFELSKHANLTDITRCLKTMVYLIEEEHKQWGLEEPHHQLIRNYCMSLN